MDKQEELKDTKKYQTKSIDSAACVLALGAEIVGAKKEDKNDKFLTFFFQADFDMDKVALQLASETLVINAAKLLQANKRMKSIIHSVPR
jgi:hypothetical protein